MEMHDTNNETKTQFMKLQYGCTVDDFKGSLLEECPDHMQASFMN